MKRAPVTALARACLVLMAVLHGAAARADERWDRWQLLLWQDRTAAQLAGLPLLGFTGTKLRATNGDVDADELARRLSLGLPFYLENLATDFYAPYHRFLPGRSVTALFDAAKARRRADPADWSVFVREPSLSDPAWRERVRSRLDRVVRSQRGNRPLFYNLGDETGIGDLAAAWDADLAPASLDGFHAWLRTQYPSLDALNAEWGTQYPSFDAAEPELTDAALRRTDGNFAQWSDFKAWMDVAFAGAVRMGTDAVHAADPGAWAALEGAQVPGWGGYDYTLLAPAVDVMEIYDYGEALDLAQAFNPALIPLRTSFAVGPRERHAVWRNLLHGGRGEVVWDEADDVVAADGSPGPRGLELAALARAIGPVASALRAAAPDPDPVAVLYSPASFRVRWLLDRQGGDRDWAARDAEREYDDNAWRASRRVLLRRLAELGVQPQFVSGAMLQAGELVARGIKVLFLPHAIALSDAEVAAVASFGAAGGTVLADTEPGLFDGHGRRRAAPPLPGVSHPQAARPDAEDAAPATLDALAGLLREAGAEPRVRLLGPDRQQATGVEARWFRGPQGSILALQAGRPWGAPPQVTIRLPSPAALSDLRAGDAPRSTDTLDLALDGIEPTVLLLGRALP